MSSAQLNKFALVKPATIEWRDNLPYSLEFDDVYYSDSGALAESDHVFLKGCQLEEDWLNLPQKNFYIAELGFGSGLNFFNTASLWRDKIINTPDLQTQSKTQAQHKNLHYISIEKRPFSLEDFKRSCFSWPQFHFISSRLIQTYPSTTYGRHQLYFSDLKLTLTLIYMPVEDALADLLTESESQKNKTKIDHWFLDGFAPSKNEAMWGLKVMQAIAALSRTGSRLATYSVAASVKGPIAEVGFKISKKIGFGRKREMLTAMMEKPFHFQKSNTVNIKNEMPWFNLSLSTSTHRVAIIGGGIAGCATAYQLSLKGIQVDLFESNKQIAQAASGAAAGIFHPQLTSDMNINSQFSWLAYLCLLNFLSLLTVDEKQDVILSQGLNRFLESAKTKQQLMILSDSLNLNQWIKEPSDFLNDTRVIHFPDAAALSMPALCSLLLNKIPATQKHIHLSSPVYNLKRINEYWTFQTDRKNYQYQHVIFCGGTNNELLKQWGTLPSNISRGQTCFISSPQLTRKINKALCEKIYLVPRDNNDFHIGTTFEKVNQVNPNDQLSTISQKEILTNTANFLNNAEIPFLTHSQIETQPLNGTFGYRLHSLDRLPIVGAAVDQNKLKQDFSMLGQKRLVRQADSYYNLPGLWLNTGYGSHGLLYSMLACQHLTSLITNDISPVNQKISNALNPSRFIIRTLKQ